MANKNCPDCHGTGKIELFTSTVVCRCVEPPIDPFTKRLVSIVRTTMGLTPEMIEDIDPNIQRHISKELNDYINETLDVDIKWADGCCSCHISPPCGFCTRYADANLDEPEYCKACGDPSPTEKDLLHKCSKCGQLVCDICIKLSNMVCRTCEYFPIGPQE